MNGKGTGIKAISVAISVQIAFLIKWEACNPPFFPCDPLLVSPGNRQDALGAEKVRATLL